MLRKPQTVNIEGVTASSDAGVLTISPPKKAEAQPKQIKVQVGSPKPVEAEMASNFATTPFGGECACPPFSFGLMAGGESGYQSGYQRELNNAMSKVL